MSDHGHNIELTHIRCYSLIRLRKCTPPCVMFHIHYSRLNRCVTLVASMVTLSIVVSFFPCKTQEVSHRPFHSPFWKRLTLDTICLTLSRRLHDISSVGRNWATTSRMCTAKESRGYLSARSKTRCILEANCSIFSPLGITLAMRKIMRRTVRRWICSERRETVNVSLRSRKGFQF